MDMIGRQLSRYRLLQEVGQGGMAVVYKATDTTLNREVAVKVLHPHLAGQEESRARLQREAHAVAKLRHENILEIFDYSGPDSAESYIVTEFIHGRTLKNFLADHPLAFPEIAEMIASEVARALEHAHQAGVIHRDVKPENVMIRDDGLIKLTDFGIAQIVDKERMTVTGQLLGSPAYMAPEHVEGRPLDFRTDVFAVGILTYQLATGQLPFRGKNPHEVLKRIADCRFAPAESVNPLVGKRLNRVIAKALQREPDARYSDVGELRRELLEDLADAGVDDRARRARALLRRSQGLGARVQAAAGGGADARAARRARRRAHRGGARAVGARAVARAARRGAARARRRRGRAPAARADGAARARAVGARARRRRGRRARRRALARGRITPARSRRRTSRARIRRRPAARRAGSTAPTPTAPATAPRARRPARRRTRDPADDRSPRRRAKRHAAHETAPPSRRRRRRRRAPSSWRRRPRR